MRCFNKDIAGLRSEYTYIDVIVMMRYTAEDRFHMTCHCYSGVEWY